jgi:sulfite exporter TauE/SafE
MRSRTGASLLTLGIILGALGAILAYAVTVSVQGLSIHEMGIILLVAGAAATLIGLVLIVDAGRRSSVVREQVHSTPDGSVRVVERDDQV